MAAKVLESSNKEELTKFIISNESKTARIFHKTSVSSVWGDIVISTFVLKGLGYHIALNKIRTYEVFKITIIDE